MFSYDLNVFICMKSNFTCVWLVVPFCSPTHSTDNNYKLVLWESESLFLLRFFTFCCQSCRFTSCWVSSRSQWLAPSERYHFSCRWFRGWSGRAGLYSTWCQSWAWSLSPPSSQEACWDGSSSERLRLRVADSSQALWRFVTSLTQNWSTRISIPVSRHSL